MRLPLPTDLFTFSVGGGVVGDLVEVEVQHVLQIVVVSPTLAHDDGQVEEKDVPAREGDTEGDGERVKAQAVGGLKV